VAGADGKLASILQGPASDTNSIHARLADPESSVYIQAAFTARLEAQSPL
jgi:hypothetical protein